VTRRPARKPSHAGRSRARAELSGGEERDEYEANRQQKEHRRGGNPKARTMSRWRDNQRLLGREASLELVGEEMLLETKMARVGAQERLRVGPTWKGVEPLVFERGEIPRSDLRRGLDICQLETSVNPGLAQAAADLQHGS
jgi:hypothetical protein